MRNLLTLHDYLISEGDRYIDYVSPHIGVINCAIVEYFDNVRISYFTDKHNEKQSGWKIVAKPENRFRRMVCEVIANNTSVQKSFYVYRKHIIIVYFEPKYWTIYLCELHDRTLNKVFTGEYFGTPLT